MANNFMDQVKNMDPQERRTLLEKLLGSLTPEQQEQVAAITRDKKQMKKLQEGLNGNDFETLLNGLRGNQDPQDFLQSPQVKQRLKDLLD